MTGDETSDIDWNALPEVPLPTALAQRVHAHARAAFERGERTRAAGVATFVAVTAAIVGYLGWAVAFLRALAPA